ncbi:MAG: class I SAM-dependent methyltransferase [Kiritimatiellae bacterium]|nr:class I SAM-dependent methyltransferase [Kiritimatiellia bacterium]
MYVNQAIAEVDNLPCSHPASVNVDVANAYYSLTKMLRPNLVVEIGCFIGFSSLHIAQALKDQGFGRQISIDAFDWDVDAGCGMENRQIVAERYRKKAGLEDVLTYIKGYSTVVYPDLLPQIQGKIDLLFIDGDHSVDGVISDFNTYSPQVRRGGYIVLHDIHPEMCGCDGPRGLIEMLKWRRAIPRHLELIELQTQDGFGVALLRKTSERRMRINAFWRSLAKRYNRYLHSCKSKRAGCGLVLSAVDGVTGQPVSKPYVVCQARGGEARLGDEHGMIAFEHYLPNRYVLDISAEGYETRCQVLIDADGSGLPKTIELTRKRTL